MQQNIWHIAKYQDNKNHPKFVQMANTANVRFTFLLGIYMKKCMDIENVGSV